MHARIAIDCHISKKISRHLPGGIQIVHQARAAEMDSLWVSDALKKRAQFLVSRDWDIVDLAERHGIHCIHIEPWVIKHDRIANVILQQVTKIFRKGKL